MKKVANSIAFQLQNNYYSTASIDNLRETLYHMKQYNMMYHNPKATYGSIGHKYYKKKKAPIHYT
jgi:hypothetical protein